MLTQCVEVCYVELVGALTIIVLHNTLQHTASTCGVSNNSVLMNILTNVFVCL
jgi:hypothetical protein